MLYKVKSRRVLHKCPNCQAALENSLDNAGEQDTCPNCRQLFIVPGVQERNEEATKQVAERLTTVVEERQRLEEVRRRADEDQR